MAKKKVPVSRSAAQETLATKRWATFLAALEEKGIVKYAADKAGITPRAAYAKYKKDAKFAELWEHALELSIQSMEIEARRRAVEGVDQPLYSNGTQVDVIRKYSDRLLMFLLKSKRPDTYADRQRSEVTLEGGANPLNVNGTVSLESLNLPLATRKEILRAMEKEKKE